MSNDFLPFCATDTGTNLISQSAYVVSTARPIGNQPGIASSAFNNKALRQATYVASQFAQYIANQANVSVLDNAVPAQLLSQIMGTFQPLAPVLTQLLSGTGTWNSTFYFFCASANATTGATYTNNGVTYTLAATISSGVVLKATGNGAPTANGGTLTKTSGTGDATITFYAIRSALYVDVHMVGGGAGGAGGSGGGSNSGGSGGDGTNSTFGTTLLVANHGVGGIGGSTGVGGLGGVASLGSGPQGLALQGGAGGSGNGSQASTGGMGGSSPFGGAGASGSDTTNGTDATANTGSGGGGGGSSSGSNIGGGAGGAGGYISAYIPAPLFAYSYSVGTGGTAGTAGSSGGFAGGAGGSGLIQVVEVFQ